MIDEVLVVPDPPVIVRAHQTVIDTERRGTDPANKQTNIPHNVEPLLVPQEILGAVNRQRLNPSYRGASFRDNPRWGFAGNAFVATAYHEVEGVYRIEWHHL